MTPTEYQTRTRELLARWDQQRRITQALEIDLQCHLERLPDAISDARHEGWFHGHRDAGAALGVRTPDEIVRAETADAIDCAGVEMMPTEGIADPGRGPWL